MPTPEPQTSDLVPVQQEIINITEDLTKQLIVSLAKTKADLIRFQTRAAEQFSDLAKKDDEITVLKREIDNFQKQFMAIQTGGSAPQVRDDVREGSDVLAPAEPPVAA